MNTINAAPANISSPISDLEGYANRLSNNLNALGSLLERMERRMINFDGPGPAAPDSPSSNASGLGEPPLRLRLEASFDRFDDLLSHVESLATRLEARF